MRSRILLAILLFVSTVASAVELKEDAPTQYIVKKGDTLWHISGVFLEAPWEWPQLWGYNPQIENPHLIYPGDVINIIYVDGEPRAVINQGPREVKLSPQVLREEINSAIPPISLRDIVSFLSRTRLASDEELDGTPVVVGMETNGLIATTGETVFGRGDFTKERARYDLFRYEAPLKDPETGETISNMLRFIASTELDTVGNATRDAEDPNDQIAKTALTKIKREVKVGDYFFEDTKKRFSSSFMPSAPTQEVDAQIAHAFDGVSQVGRFSVVALNKGAQDGIAEGNVLAVFEPEREVEDTVNGGDIILPTDRQGLVMVFQVWEEASFALVMKATHPLKVGYHARNP